MYSDHYPKLTKVPYKQNLRQIYENIGIDLFYTIFTSLYLKIILKRQRILKIVQISFSLAKLN